MKVVYSDNGMKFICLNIFFWEQGTLHQTSVLGHLNKIGRCTVSIVTFLMRCVLWIFQVDLPKWLLEECILTVDHLINRIPSSLLKGKTPYESIENYPLIPILRALVV